MATHPDPGSPPRLLWADAARTIACGLVVLVHVNYLTRPGISAWWPGTFASAPVYSLTVPLFFFVAGTFARVRGRDGGLPTARSWFGGLLLKLYLPLLIWGAVLTALLQPDEGESPVILVTELVTGAWQLYFLLALLQLHALHFALEVWAPRLRPARLVAWAAALSAAAHLACELTQWWLGGDCETVAYYARKCFAVWAVYYAMGLAIRATPDVWRHLWRYRAALVCATLVSAGAYAYELARVDAWLGYVPMDQTLVAALATGVAGTLTIAVLLRRLEESKRGRRLLEGLAALAPDTFGVYLVHTVVLIPLYRWFQASPWYSVEAGTVPALWLVTLALSLAVVRLARLPGLRVLGRVALGAHAGPLVLRPTTGFLTRAG